MRNIAGFAVLVIIFFGTQAVTAQEKPRDSYALSLSYQFGFLYGQAEEIVYPSDTVAPLLSQLLWDMKPVLYNGLQLDFSRINLLETPGFFSSLALKYGIPDKGGIMEDRDWQSMENDALTSFSSHDNITRELFMVDAAAGISIPLKSLFLIKAFVHTSYMRFCFSGMDGHGIYARPLERGKYALISDNPRIVYFKGKVINYTQEWIIIALGHSFRVNFNEHFSAGLSFLISPLVFCLGLDEHLATRTQFNDYTLGGLLLEPGVELSLSPVQWLSLSLDCSWRHISGTRGASYNRSYAIGSYVQQGEAGTGLAIFNTGLRIKVRL